MKKLIRASSDKPILSFMCPSCHNKTVYDTERDVHKVADVGYHDVCICDECGGEFWAEPQYNGKVAFVAIEDVESATKAEKRACKKCNSSSSIVAGCNFRDLELWDQIKMISDYIDSYQGSRIFEDFADSVGCDVEDVVDLFCDAEYHKDIYVPKSMQKDSDYANDDLYGDDDDFDDVESATKAKTCACRKCNHSTVSARSEYDEKGAAIEELAMSGEVSLGRCSRSTLYRWKKEINERLEAQKCDWRVKAIPKDNSLIAISLDDVTSATGEGAEDYEDEIKEIGQEFTSENTSINSGKLPAVFNMVSFEPGTVNIDYGGGRFDNVAEYLSQYDVINLVYDPYNRTKEHNQEVIKLVREHGGADTATCSNVLNVIKESEVRLNVLQNIRKLVKSSGTVYITVYEGTGKGDSRPTKSGYQLNKKTADYLEEIQQVFPDATRKGKLIICHPGADSVETATDIRASISSLKDEVMKAAKNVMMSESFGFSEDEVEDYLVVEVNKGSEATQVEVRAEVSYDSLMELADALNPIVSKYDSEAYFDAVEPGIIEAFIRNTNAATGTMNIAAGMYDYPEPNPDPPESPEYDELDPEEEYIEVSIDDIVVVGEDREWDFENTDCHWADGEDNMDNHYSEEHRVYLDDGSGVVEKCYELLDPFMPADPGRYRIKCDVSLVYEVSGIERQITDAWFDDDHGFDYDEEVYTDNAESEYLPKKSSVTNFTFEQA